MSERKKIAKNQKGYAILLIVLILSSVSLTVVTSLLIWGFYFNRTSLDLEKSKQAMALTDACGEAALQEIRNNDAYIGTNSLIFVNGNCAYTVSGSSPDKNIQSTGTVDTIVRKVMITTNQINPQIVISSWQEVADF